MRGKAVLGTWPQGLGSVKIIMEAALEGLIRGPLLLHAIFCPDLKFCGRRNLALNLR